MNRYDTRARLADAERRIAQTVIVATVAQVDYQYNRYRLKSGETLTDWLPVIQRRAGQVRTWEPLHEGEQVVVAAASGDLAQGIIIGSLPSATTGHAGTAAGETVTIFEDGTRITQDSSDKSLTVTAPAGSTVTTTVGGSTVVQTEDTLAVKTKAINLEAANIVFKGDVAINGAVDITGESVTHNDKRIDATHRHGQVEPGGGTSGDPI